MTDQEVIDRARANFEAEDAQQAVYDLQGKMAMELKAVDDDATAKKQAVVDAAVAQKQTIEDNYKPQIDAATQAVSDATTTDQTLKQSQRTPAQQATL
jgi:hypothetical protein